MSGVGIVMYPLLSGETAAVLMSVNMRKENVHTHIHIEHDFSKKAKARE
jgi:hypothetical protein